MGIKVAINGYGRIGRQVVRAIFDYKLQDQLDIVAINASGSIETNAHLTKFDTVHGRVNSEVSHDEKHLIIDGKKSPYFSTRVHQQRESQNPLGKRREKSTDFRSRRR